MRWHQGAQRKIAPADRITCERLHDDLDEIKRTPIGARPSSSEEHRCAIWPIALLVIYRALAESRAVATISLYVSDLSGVISRFNIAAVLG